MNGVIYARYSSHNQREESIEQQIEECTAFARANNITIVEIYADKAISGKTDKRPQFQKMMRDAEKKSFEVVVAYKSNRIARNMFNALAYEDKLGKLGIETLYAKEEFGNTAAGRFALRTMMNVNQFYSENMAEDIRRGLMDNAQQCKVNGAIKYGYKKGEDGKYAINEEEATVVREIFRRTFAGDSAATIAADFNARGIRTRKGKDWTRSSFQTLLMNNCYCGTYKHSGVVIENGIPPIISKEEWLKMQDYLNNRPATVSARNGEKAADYILTGNLFCGHCGEPMTGMSGHGRNGVKYYYRCNKSKIHRCDKKSIRKEVIEELVVNYTLEYVLTDETIKWIAENSMQVFKNDEKKQELASLKERQSENKKALNNLMRALERGIFSDTVNDRLKELEEEKKDLEKLVAKLEDSLNIDISEEKIVFALQQLRNGVLTSREYQKRLIKTFIDRIDLYDDTLRITYYYGDKTSKTIEKGAFSVDYAAINGSTNALSAPPYIAQTNQDYTLVLIPWGIVFETKLS